MMGVFVLQVAGVALMRETVSRNPGALASLRPEIRLPRTLRGPVLAATPVLFAVWALAGLYGALGPSLVRALTGSADVVEGGLSLFVLTLTAVLAIVVLRRAGARTVMLTGILTLITGVAVTTLGLGLKSTAVFFAGTAISGAGFGSGFQGSIRTVVPQAAAHERAGVLSLLYIVSYLGLGLPATPPLAPPTPTPLLAPPQPTPPPATPPPAGPRPERPRGVFPASLQNDKVDRPV
jgi:hypothetical protein